MISEIILKSTDPILVRVLLKFNIALKKYPDFGTWCYIINAGDSVVIFDTGPNYYSPMPILLFRRYLKKTGNLKLILYALQKYFPGKTVREILLSHYHFDHSEIAPQLQQKIKEKFGNVPPIRLHGKDLLKKRFMGILPEDINKVLKSAENKVWVFGMPMEDHEPIKGTDFYIKYLPGHTTGTIGLVSDRYRIIICGWWMVKEQAKLVKMVTHLINEDNKQLKETVTYLQSKQYTQYYYHPVVSNRN